MERIKNLQFENMKEAFIKENFAEKKGRNIDGIRSGLTCYLSTSSPIPNLPFLTALMLEELQKDIYRSYLWAKDWDKSIISIAPDGNDGAVLLEDIDIKRKMFVPVQTIIPINTNEIINTMPRGSLAKICVNSQPMTTDAFLITYFHMVNEFIWDLSVELNNYERALDLVIQNGFSVGQMNDEEIMEAKSKDPKMSIRIYGSKVDKFVPQIMGGILK